MAADPKTLPRSSALSRTQRLELFLHCCAHRKLVGFIVGGVGIGKTEVVRSSAERLGVDFVDMTATEIPDECEISGQPVAVTRGEEVVLHKALTPIWQQLSDSAAAERSGGKAARPTMIFVDELTAAEPEVLKTLLNLMSQRETRYVDLPESTMLVSAGNFRSMSSHAFDLPEAFRNRLVFWDFSNPTPAEWRRWVHLAAPISDADYVEPETPWAPTPAAARCSEAEINRRIQFWSTVVEGFAKTHSDAWSPGSDRNKTAREAQEAAFATPRSYFAAVSLLAELELHGGVRDPEELFSEFCKAALGPDVGPALAGYARELDLPDPEDWLADPESATVYANRSDKTTIALRRLCDAALRDRPDFGSAPDPTWRNQRALAALTALCKIAELGERSLAEANAVRLRSQWTLQLTAANRSKVGVLDKRMRKVFGKGFQSLLETAADVAAAVAAKTDNSDN